MGPVTDPDEWRPVVPERVRQPVEAAIHQAAPHTPLAWSVGMSDTQGLPIHVACRLHLPAEQARQVITMVGQACLRQPRLDERDRDGGRILEAWGTLHGILVSVWARL